MHVLTVTKASCRQGNYYYFTACCTLVAKVAVPLLSRARHVSFAQVTCSHRPTSV